MFDIFEDYEAKGPFHCMVDLETVDNKPTSAIASIGAVMFDEKGLYDEFYVVVDHKTCLELGMTKSDDTMRWWASQSDEAKRIFADDTPKDPINVALLRFSSWFKDKNGMYFWGNGADFDNAIMSVAYGLCKMQQPWKYSNNRCFRTVKHKGYIQNRKGTYHNALDDAKTQARYMIDNLLVPSL